MNELAKKELLPRVEKLIGWASLFLVAATVTGFLIHQNWSKKEPEKAARFCGNDRHHGPKSERGKTLFLNNCASCHNKNMVDDMTGPGLRGVRERWSRWPEADLFQFIRGSQRMVKKGHPRAVAVWKKYGRSTMNDFPSLTDNDLKALFAYIE